MLFTVEEPCCLPANSTPYREHLVEHFTVTYSRIGLPDPYDTVALREVVRHPCWFCLVPDGPSCYDHAMDAFVCEVDQTGLRRLVPEDLIPGDELVRLAGMRPSQPATLVRALLHDRDAEAVRTEINAGRHHDACGLLLNRAVEIISIAAASLAVARPVR